MVYLGKFSVLAPVITLALLAGVAWEWHALHLPQGDLEPYHARVRDAISEIPLRVGDWLGADKEVPKAAVRLLRPNIILSRQYTNHRTGVKASLLLVHCKDTRDLRGHYPPVCYPAHGWELVDREEKEWTVEGRSLSGMQYRFFRREVARTNNITIYNFMARPGGGVEREMPGLRRASEDRRLRARGGAQFQLLFAESVPEEDRDQAFEELMEPLLDALDLIVTGDGNEF